MKMKIYKNKEKIKLIDWFEKKCEGCAIISDDRGNWACSGDGFQNIEEGDFPIDIQTTFFIEADRWKKSIFEAIEDFKNQE